MKIPEINVLPKNKREKLTQKFEYILIQNGEIFNVINDFHRFDLCFYLLSRTQHEHDFSIKITFLNQNRFLVLHLGSEMGIHYFLMIWVCDKAVLRSSAFLSTKKRSSGNTTTPQPH